MAAVDPRRLIGGLNHQRPSPSIGPAIFDLAERCAPFVMHSYTHAPIGEAKFNRTPKAKAIRDNNIYPARYYVPNRCCDKGVRQTAGET